MIAGVWRASDIPIDPRGREAARDMRAQQQVVEPQSSIATPSPALVAQNV